LLRCPTSELPIWPAGKPTSSSDASIDVCGHVARSRSQFGIRALVIALSGASARQPKPSRISRTTGRATGLTAGIMVTSAAEATSRRGRFAVRARPIASSTLSFYLCLPLIRAPNVVRAKQLDADRRVRAVRRHADLALRAAPPLAGQGRHQHGSDPALQPPQCRPARCSRAEGVRRREAAGCDPYPVVPAREPWSGTRQARRAPRRRLLRYRAEEPYGGGHAREGRIQGDLHASRRDRRLEKGRVARGEMTWPTVRLRSRCTRPGVARSASGQSVISAQRASR